jgi:hypothetical protein
LALLSSVVSCAEISGLTESIRNRILNKIVSLFTTGILISVNMFKACPPVNLSSSAIVEG